MSKLNVTQKLAAAEPLVDISLLRDAALSFLRQSCAPHERISYVRNWNSSCQSRQIHQRWFQQVLERFLHSLPGDLTVGQVIAELEAEPARPPRSAVLQRWADRVRIPVLHYWLTVRAQQASQREQLRATRF